MNFFNSILKIFPLKREKNLQSDLSNRENSTDNTDISESTEENKAIGIPDDLHDEYLSSSFVSLLENRSNYSAILFEPEEESCFSYLFSEKGIKRISDIKIQKWEQSSAILKNLDQKTLKYGNDIFFISQVVSLSNFGQRISIILEPVGPDYQERLNISKKKCIKVLNSVKPATSLTESNRIHLDELIKRSINGNEKELIELMENEGLINENALSEYSKLCNDTGLPLYSTIIRNGMFPRKKITSIIACWFGIPYYDIEEERIEFSIAESIGREFCLKHKLIPFKTEESTVYIAMFDPFNQEAIKKIENTFQKKAKVMICSEEDIRNKIEILFEKADE